MLRRESGSNKQVEKKFGDWLGRLLVNIEVPEEFTSNGLNNTPFLEPSNLLSHSKISRVCHQSTGKGAINDGRSLFTSLNTLGKVRLKSGLFPK